MPSDAPLDAEAVTLGFHLVLRRPPETAQVVRHYLGLGLTFQGFLAILMESEEFLERQRRILARGDLALDVLPASPQADAAARVLLFGAFGNGNVGDTAQAAAVAALLRRFAPARTVFAATSWERQAAYAPEGLIVLRPDALTRPEHMRARTGPLDGGGADLLVIGGGGLLGAPHFPLHDRRWVQWFVGRGVPYALLGVGGSASALAEPGWRDAYQLLLARAVFVGVRDAETLAAARAIQPQACWFPDPILAEALLAPVAASGGASGGERATDVVLIPRAPNGPADQAALDGMLAFAAAARAAGSQVVIAALEPATDRAALADLDVRYLTDWDALLTLCRGARVVISARLHGVIAGLAAGCAVHGLAQPKTGDLLARLGLQGWFAAAGWPDQSPDLSPAAVSGFHRAAAPGLAQFRQATDTAIAEAARVLEPLLRARPPVAHRRPGR